MLLSAFQMIRAMFMITLIILNTMVFSGIMVAFSPLKLMLPFSAWRHFWTAWFVEMGATWSTVNSRFLDWSHSTKIVLDLPEGLSRNRSYLVLANHQTWVDMPVLEYALARRIPGRRIFIKQSLIWVPFLGQACWAMDFPFMKRYTAKQLAKSPELRERNLETVRKNCERMKGMSSTLLNFSEGTRFTSAKHAKQRSPYTHLLKPKIAGVATVIGLLGDSLDAVLDLTIVYPDNPECPTVIDLFAGRIPQAVVQARLLPVPGSAESEDSGASPRVRKWLLQIWKEKDHTIAEILGKPQASAA